MITAFNSQEGLCTLDGRKESELELTHTPHEAGKAFLSEFIISNKVN